MIAKGRHIPEQDMALVFRKNNRIDIYEPDGSSVTILAGYAIANLLATNDDTLRTLIANEIVAISEQMKGETDDQEISKSVVAKK